MIVELFNRRDETAIREISAKYGSYFRKIAMNILQNAEDSEECVNDAYLKAWNAIPPDNPPVLPAYIGKITRNLSINKYNRKNAAKRGSGEAALILDELENCVSGGGESEFDAKETGKVITAFLGKQSKESRVVFIRRYWYADSVAEISKRFGMNQNKVKTLLFRTRNKLREHLLKEGVVL